MDNPTAASVPPTTSTPSQPSTLQVYPVILASKKPVNVAKFFTPVDFSKSKKSGPIKMYRAKMEEEPEKKEEGKHFFKKKKMFERKVRDIKNVPWRLETPDKVFEGKTESNTSQYALFELEGNQFKITPVGDWVDFRPYKQISTLTTEQAEELMNKRSMKVEKVEDWARKIANLTDKKAEKEAGETKGPKKKTYEEEEEDEFRNEVAQSEDNEKFAAFGEVDPEEKSRKDSRGKDKVIKGEDDGDMDDGEDEENGDGDEPDFFGKFDDDEDPNITFEDNDDETPATKAGKEVEADDDVENDLDESGKEIKKLLKREEDDSSEELDESDEEEDLDDDINLNDLHMLYPRNSPLSLTKIKDESKEEKGSSQSANDKSKGKKPVKKAKKDEKEKKDDKEKKDEKKDDKDKKGKKAKRAADSTSTTATPQNKKTKVDSKTPQAASPPSNNGNGSNAPASKPSVSPNKLAESEVIKIIKHHKRITIPELLAKFRPFLLTEADKTSFKSMITRLAVAEDFSDGKFLVLKPEYRDPK
eukprot:TRINITY_DN2719_c0_g1_i2.p1 TRINITY_DN2719_c0_g1~~TRINITY_DN2719_c0_g1_i2.p1  ORF type:complete len:530 (-),score=175.71 TRINITY_DN2719_c0_g1_i2:270-1859(-)